MTQIQVHVLDGGMRGREIDAAHELASMIQSTARAEDSGTVVIIPSVSLWGQSTKDIDIIVAMNLRSVSRRYVCNVRTSGNDTEYSGPVEFKRLLFTLELKDHDPGGIRLLGDRVYVLYRDGEHDATSQSVKQMHALKRHLEAEFVDSPYIINLVWLPNYPRTQRNLPSNVLPSGATIDDLLTAALKLQGAKRWRPEYYPEVSSSKPEVFRALPSALRKPPPNLPQVGKLTRDRVEKITRQLIDTQKYAAAIGSKMVVLRGRAGTGKTIKLLRLAHDLYEQGRRVLLLTYNKVLVSDLERLRFLAGVPDDGEQLRIMTVHQLVYRLGEALDIFTRDDDFLEMYDTVKGMLIEHLKAGIQRRTDIRDVQAFRWDAVLVDEAQDWPPDERELLMLLVEPARLVIADGIDQLVRNNPRLDWTEGVDFHKPVVFEKRSLRQKRNLVTFLREYARRMDVPWDLEASGELLGGQVMVLCKEYDQVIHNGLFRECVESGNAAYEMLFVVPHDRVDKERRRCELVADLATWSPPVKLWDGTSHDERKAYPTDAEEHRVVQYHSCRGLEGWTVVCFDIDLFYEHQLRAPLPDEGEQLTIATREERQRRNAALWSMIAFTRAVDTLVLTLANPRSEYSRALLSIAKELKDIVTVVD